jgi:hypothetical protein
MKTIQTAYALLLLAIIPLLSFSQIQTIGAGSYEVYTGSAFHIRHLMDSSQWSYVRRMGDGLWWHPVGYHNTDGYNNVTNAEWKTLATYFHSRKALVEGDMYADRVADDIPAIRRVVALNFEPSYAFVNRIQDTSTKWPARVDTNLTRGVKSCTMLAPHVMERYPDGFYDVQNEIKRRQIMESYGSSVDAPTHLFVRQTEAGAKYRQTVYDATDFCHRNGRKFLFLISPNASGDNFLRDAIQTVHYLEDNDRIPDFYGVLIYGLSWGINLTPESLINTAGDVVCANTVTGVSRWLLKHARADEGELDLWVQAPDGSSHLKNIVCHSADEVTPVIANNWTGTNGTFTYTLNLKNRSKYIDFIPTLKASVTGLPTGWTIKYMYAGADITNAITSKGYLFYKNHRLMPSDERAITITVSKTGETQLPATLDMSFEVRPQPNSIFVRDVIKIKTNRTDMWEFDASVENWNNPARLTMAVSNSINTMSINGSDSYVYSPNFLNVAAEKFNYVIIRMQNQSAATSAELFWTTTADATFNGTKRVGIPIVANDTKQRYYIVDLSNNPHWTGTIKQIRFDPTTAASGTVHVDFIKLTGAYPSTLAAIPGLMEAENFNFGGQGNAYYETTPATNSGNQYRTGQGVDIAAHPTESNNHVVGWNATGEWLEYLANVDESLNYDIQITYSAPAATGKIQFYCNGEILGAIVNLPATGAYTTYGHVKITRAIPKGVCILKLEVVAAGFNIDKIAITKSNRAPSNITMSATAINENLAVGTTIGTMTSTDPDAGNTFAYSLAAGGADNANFTIAGNVLKTNAVFDFETKASYSVKLRTTDQGGLFFEKTFNITVIDENETVTQTIVLEKGWNLISTNVHPADSSIATLFNGLDLAEIKTMNTYWRKDQPTFLNPLQAISAGEGYLVKMNAPGTLSVAGTPNLHGFKNLEGLTTGWNLIGCPYPSAAPIAGIFGSMFWEIKDFSGFGIQYGATNTLHDLVPGKGYFVKTK